MKELHQNTAFAAILDRREAESNVATYFADEIRVLSELADYGTHLIPRCWTASNRDVADTMLLLVLLKQAVGFLDAGQILLGEGAVGPSYLQLRGLFEVSVYLHWILKCDTVRRARAYYVANLRKERLWAHRAQKGSPAAKALRSDFKGLPGLNPFKERQKEVAARIAELDERLRRADLRQMNAAFDRRRGKRPFDPEWYGVLFPKKGRPSLYTLAKQLHRRAEYRLIYEQGSEMMHSSRMGPHIHVTPTGVRIRPLRELTDFPLIGQLFMGQAVALYKAILSRYRSAETENFARKYAEAWRPVFLAQRKVTYEYKDRPLEL